MEGRSKQFILTGEVMGIYLVLAYEFYSSFLRGWG